MSRYEGETRKATIDINNWLTSGDIPKLSFMTRTLLLRYGFGQKKLLKIIETAFPEFEANIETDEVKLR